MIAGGGEATDLVAPVDGAGAEDWRCCIMPAKAAAGLWTGVPIEVGVGGSSKSRLSSSSSCGRNGKGGCEGAGRGEPVNSI